ncbi:hypothetical protein [Limisalsivibrio acetivorans]|uniref:hypothetical protein n=1 Tax=Limisalsivibrio acetivorans TaxID=1304888 RepID=UPI0003B3CCE8|nr:hypothetical protein [Limisalsivibrio acetivorans]
MKVDSVFFERYDYPVLIFDDNGYLQYMNTRAGEFFDTESNNTKCHNIFRGLNSECRNHINCLCGRELISCANSDRVSFVRKSKTLKGDLFFIVDRQKDGDAHIEFLTDISDTAKMYIEEGWMTEEELENTVIEPDRDTGPFYLLDKYMDKTSKTMH